MSNTKTVMSQAANTLVKPPVNVEDVFSTYLYDGNGSTQTITNGIDLAGEGGLVWGKRRNLGNSHWLIDTERGAGNRLESDGTGAQTDTSAQFPSFNSDGFTVATADNEFNNSAGTYASWTFRKAPKFFDVVTYTGTGSVRTISHNLGSVPGCIIVKAVSGAALGGVSNWTVYHRGVDATNPEQYRLYLDTTGARVDQTNPWNDTAPTSTEFTVGTDSYLNANGDTYVAYLFAHNDGDGDFGPDGDLDAIKCGSYTGNGSTDGPEIDLGFEPQWVLIKNADIVQNWYIIDNMRGMAVNVTDGDATLLPNTSGSENAGNIISPLPNGFKITASNSQYNGSGNNILYIAIRRGTKVPESATEVFDMDTLGSTTPNPPSYNAGFPVDLGIMKSKTSGTDFWRVGARLTGETRLKTNSNEAEATDTQHKFDYQDGWYDAGAYVDSQYQSWMWKRAPGYFDAVAYSGDGVAGRTVSHNLTVAPEMIWVKSRSAGDNWYVYHKDLTSAAYALILNSTLAQLNAPTLWNSTTPTDSVFTVGSDGGINGSTKPFIAYLFASLPGISKVGSYTGNGSTLNIDCGFTSGARFVLIKKIDEVKDWVLFDTSRGIVAGNDDYLLPNKTDANNAGNADFIDPYSAGFSLTGVSSFTNDNGGKYIFYAIA